MKEESKAVALPHELAHELQDLARARQMMTTQIETIIRTARLTMGVPEGWVLIDPAVGFVPPAEQGKKE